MQAQARTAADIRHSSASGTSTKAPIQSTNSGDGRLTGADLAVERRPVRAFGWTNPILVDGENGVIAGHGRLLAARKLGLCTVPVIELAGLREAERRAYILADNRLALNAGWDQDLLAAEVADLDALGVDLSLAGSPRARSARCSTTSEQVGLLRTRPLPRPWIRSVVGATSGASVSTGCCAAMR